MESREICLLRKGSEQKTGQEGGRDDRSIQAKLRKVKDLETQGKELSVHC